MIDKQIEVLKHSIQLLHVRLAGVQRQRNAMVSPVARLPLELLIKVFHIIIQDGFDDGWSLSTQMDPLALTCSYWRDVIDKAPGLWSYISLGDSGGRNTKNLAKSGNCGLDVWFPFSDRVISRDTPKHQKRLMHKSFKEVCGHMWRWKRADILLRDSWTGFEFAKGLETPAPMLETATVRVAPLLEGDPWEVDLFGGQAGGLKELTISGFVLPWDSAVLSDLQLLSITRTGYPGPSTFQILTILRNCPRLVDLKLGDWSTGPNDDDALAEALSPICLDALEALRIAWMPVQDSHTLVTRILAPNCKYFKYDRDVGDQYGGSTHRDDPEERADSAISAITPFFNTIVASSKPRLDLICKREMVGCRLSSEDDRVFHVRFTYIRLHDTLNRVATLLKPILPISITSISCVLNNDPLKATELCDVLAQFECIEELHVYQPFKENRGHEGLMEYLSIDDGNRFPNLHTLSVIWDLDTLAAVRKMVEIRVSSPSARFKSLTVARQRAPNEIERTDREAIVELLAPSGAVSWEFLDGRDENWDGDSSDEE